MKEKVIYIDIDDTICYYEEPTKDYSKALPNHNRINIVNDLYKYNKIVLWTARGTVTGKDWSNVTKKQLSEWNVKYNELKFGKPAFDLLIDDKAITCLEQVKLLSNLVD